LAASPNVVRVIESMGIIWAGHVAFMGDIRKEYRILTGQLEGL
jgi:hypothetical protein